MFFESCLFSFSHNNPSPWGGYRSHEASFFYFMSNNLITPKIQRFPKGNFSFVELCYWVYSKRTIGLQEYFGEYLFVLVVCKPNAIVVFFHKIGFLP